MRRKREQGGGRVRREEGKGGRRREEEGGRGKEEEEEEEERNNCMQSFGLCAKANEPMVAVFLITWPMRRDCAPREVSWRAPLALSVLNFYGYMHAPDPMRRETLCGATPVA